MGPALPNPPLQRDSSKPLSRKLKPLPLPLPLPLPSVNFDENGSNHPAQANFAAAATATPMSSLDRTARPRRLGNGSLPLQIEEVNPKDTKQICLLGHGSSGRVYKVQHKRTDKLYALKVIQHQDQQECSQVLTEMEILRHVQSPYVVQCFGASEKEGEISFVLEYMDGGTLADVLEAKKTLSERYLADVAKKALRGLWYLHSKKIIHRDIKPSNILLGRNHEVKIADFGVSTILKNTLDQCQTFVGTCLYMSPDRFDPQSHGGDYNGFAADIWSLGLTLLECAIGHFPLLKPGEKENWATLMFAILNNPPPSPPENASAEFKDFIEQCLQKDPLQRPRASQLLKHPFLTKFKGTRLATSASC